MNAKFVIVFIGIAFVCASVNAETTSFPDDSGNECGENEVWNECGSPCPPKCGQFKRPMCMTVCVPSCQCTRGFVRNFDGKCVSPEKCPIKAILPFPEDPVGPQLPPTQ
uniref:TIL domain-containing protein n=1 Tax=Panagrolaimus sp. ES5 TaxID=591445 RepID=A0AC34FSN7_9BILA